MAEIIQINELKMAIVKLIEILFFASMIISIALYFLRLKSRFQYFEVLEGNGSSLLLINAMKRIFSFKNLNYILFPWFLKERTGEDNALRLLRVKQNRYGTLFLLCLLISVLLGWMITVLK